MWLPALERTSGRGRILSFIRNNYIDATNFFSSSKDQLHLDQFGGTFGGRIIRDKLLVSRAISVSSPNSCSPQARHYVPTVDNSGGNFSITDPVATRTTRDPRTGIKLINKQLRRHNRRYLESQRPSARLGRIPSKLQQTAPQATIVSPRTPEPAENGLGSMRFPKQLTENLFVSRIDWSINSKHSLLWPLFARRIQQRRILFTDQRPGHLLARQPGARPGAYPR